MTVDRWNCASYCLCKSRKGHFEKASDDGVWVLYVDHQAEVERLRAGLLGHACFCGSNDTEPNTHSEDCPYRKWALPEKP